MDIASNLWALVHNDTAGHGGYYNDLDMLQVSRGLQLHSLWRIPTAAVG